jgi:hypothetical protein
MQPTTPLGPDQANGLNQSSRSGSTGDTPARLAPITIYQAKRRETAPNSQGRTEDRETMSHRRFGRGKIKGFSHRAPPAFYFDSGDEEGAGLARRYTPIWGFRGGADPTKQLESQLQRLSLPSFPPLILALSSARDSVGGQTLRVSAVALLSGICPQAFAANRRAPLRPLQAAFKMSRCA